MYCSVHGACAYPRTPSVHAPLVIAPPPASGQRRVRGRGRRYASARAEPLGRLCRHHLHRLLLTHTHLRSANTAATTSCVEACPADSERAAAPRRAAPDRAPTSAPSSQESPCRSSVSLPQSVCRPQCSLARQRTSARAVGRAGRGGERARSGAPRGPAACQTSSQSCGHIHHHRRPGVRRFFVYLFSEGREAGGGKS